ARLRIRVDEDEPFARGMGGAPVSRTRDLVDGLEDDPRARGPRKLCRAVVGIVVANDQLGRPAALGERFHGGAHAAERVGKKPLLVEGRDDDRDAHAEISTGLSPAFYGTPKPGRVRPPPG